MSAAPHDLDPQPGEPILDWAMRIAQAVRSGWLTLDPATGLELQNGPGGKSLRRSKRLGAKWAGTSGIGAASGVTPGQGAVVVYDFDGTSLQGGAPDVAYNMSSLAVGAGTVLIEPVDGYWFVVWEEC